MPRYCYRYEDLAPPLFWLFVNRSCCAEQNEASLQAVREAASTRRGTAAFVWLDGERYAHHARSLAATPGALPVLAAERLVGEAHEHYVYSGSILEQAQVSAAP